MKPWKFLELMRLVDDYAKPKPHDSNYTTPIGEKIVHTQVEKERVDEPGHVTDNSTSTSSISATTSPYSASAQKRKKYTSDDIDTQMLDILKANLEDRKKCDEHTEDELK